MDPIDWTVSLVSPLCIISSIDKDSRENRPGLRRSSSLLLALTENNGPKDRYTQVVLEHQIVLLPVPCRLLLSHPCGSNQLSSLAQTETQIRCDSRRSRSRNIRSRCYNGDSSDISLQKNTSRSNPRTDRIRELSSGFTDFPRSRFLDFVNVQQTKHRRGHARYTPDHHSRTVSYSYEQLATDHRHRRFVLSICISRAP